MFLGRFRRYQWLTRAKGGISFFPAVEPNFRRRLAASLGSPAFIYRLARLPIIGKQLSRRSYGPPHARPASNGRRRGGVAGEDWRVTVGSPQSKRKRRTGARLHSVVWNLVNEGTTPRSLLEQLNDIGKRLAWQLVPRHSTRPRPGGLAPWACDSLSTWEPTRSAPPSGEPVPTLAARSGPTRRWNCFGAAFACSRTGATRRTSSRSRRCGGFPNRRANGATASCCDAPISWRLSSRRD